MKALMAAGVLAGMWKFAAEKGFEKYAKPAYARYVEWSCDWKSRGDYAKKLQRSAFDSWDKKNTSQFHSEYKKAVDVYEKAMRECDKPAEATYQLSMAYCNGYGVDRNVGLGQSFLALISEDQRVMLARRNDPKFCRD